jgi:Phage Mu protein F like protein
VKKIYNPDYDKAFYDYLRYGKVIRQARYIFVAKSLELEEFYIWRTREDLRVRPAHAANNGKVFSWNEPPPTLHPGQSYNCRCVAESIHSTFPVGFEHTVNRSDIKTWPQVPINDKLIEGLPSKAVARAYGNKSLYDQYGGEWKPHTPDERHNLHWDYKAAGRCSEWQNIPINNVPTEIKKMRNKQC